MQLPAMWTSVADSATLHPPQVSELLEPDLVSTTIPAPCSICPGC